MKVLADPRDRAKNHDPVPEKIDGYQRRLHRFHVPCPLLLF